MCDLAVRVRGACLGAEAFNDRAPSLLCATLSYGSRGRQADGGPCARFEHEPPALTGSPRSAHYRAPRRLLMLTTQARVIAGAVICALALWRPDAQAQTKVKFALDWQVQGPQAPFITAKAI